MLIKSIIFIHISLCLQALIKAEVPRNRFVSDEKSIIEQRVDALEREIGRLNTDNRYLRLKLERVEQKATALEQQLKNLNLGATKNESTLEQLLAKDLNSALVNCLLHQTGVSQAVPKTKASSNVGNEISKPQVVANKYDAHFNCIENCGDTNNSPKTCAEALAANRTGDGIYAIYATNGSLKPFYVYCLQDAYGDNAWLIIQRRQVGNTNFARNWTEYVQGFGELNGDYWLGLERIHALTAQRKHELWIQMKDNAGMGRFASYAEFAIGNETENFRLIQLGNYTGDAGNSLEFNYDAPFSTYDRDNDSDEENNCAAKRMSGWWFRDCKHSLNGLYDSTDYGTGINWIGWHDYRYSLSYVHVAIRPISVDLLKRTPMVIKPVWYEE